MIQTGQIKGTVFLTGLLGLVGGCVGVGVPNGQGPGSNDGTPPGDHMVDPGDSVPDLTVTLRVSNPTPRPNESVSLTCSLVNDSGANVTFNFQPTFGRLVVDHAAGTAGFILDESDVGIALTFTCNAIDENGAGEPSNSQTIVASP